MKQKFEQLWKSYIYQMFQLDLLKDPIPVQYMAIIYNSNAEPQTNRDLLK